MTPVQDILDRANRRHFREITLAAAKPSQRDFGVCRACGETLTTAEIIERHCSHCGAAQGGDRG
ncbi:hypothetical protein [Allorhizobium undicola]|uniref:hypothetical protein n=1 Tax=Allorhizobium undicola TaxID=78527 RepID=UPI000562F09A|nr:hypothetical protein [Allorhizobium undicola]